MIEMRTAFTEEMDDADVAIKDIMEQLRPEALREKSVGIVTCYSEYANTGVAQAVCAAMPFDVVGCTTLGNGVSGDNVMMGLCLTVLTGADIEIACVASEPIGTETRPIQQACAQAVKQLGGEARLALAFLPLLDEMAGETMLEAMDSSLGVPVFGTMACDHRLKNSECRIFHNGSVYEDRLAMVLLRGDFSARFVVVTTSQRQKLGKWAKITGVDGTRLTSVNGRKPLDYMQSLGLFPDGLDGSNLATPLVVDFCDGTTLAARAIYSMNEQGDFNCGGRMPQDGLVSVGMMEERDVLDGAAQMMKELLSQRADGLLLVSCLTRNIALNDLEAEMELVGESARGVPYHFCYSGGEICPVFTGDGQWRNRFHNFTLVGCAFG